MRRQSGVSKQQLLDVINQIQASPRDRVRILGDIGVTGVGVGLGAVAAGTVAATVGVTSIPVVTSAASLFGISVLAATPMGWVLGAGAVGGVLTYGISRLIRNGGLSEGRKLELLQLYRDRLKHFDRAESLCESTEFDRNQFFLSLFDVIEKDMLEPRKAKQLIEHVESGAIPLSKAYALVANLLERQR